MIASFVWLCLTWKNSKKFFYFYVSFISKSYLYDLLLLFIQSLNSGSSVIFLFTFHFTWSWCTFQFVVERGNLPDFFVSLCSSWAIVRFALDVNWRHYTKEPTSYFNFWPKRENLNSDSLFLWKDMLGKTVVGKCPLLLISSNISMYFGVSLTWSIPVLLQCCL